MARRVDQRARALEPRPTAPTPDELRRAAEKIYGPGGPGRSRPGAPAWTSAAVQARVTTPDLCHRFLLDVELIKSQCQTPAAVAALQRNSGDVVNAIMDLTMDVRPPPGPSKF